MVNAWALLVVSSEGQRENLSDYLEMAQSDARSQGWTLERIDEFQAVASGKLGVRAPMVALVAAIAALPPEQRPAWVWMRRVDRVGRGRATDSMLALYSLFDLGVRIWDHDTGEVRLDTAEGELPALLKTWFARVDNEIRSGKARAYFDARRKNGAAAISNKRPYGLRVIKGGAVEEVPGEADIVRKIFEMRIAGIGATTIGKAVRDIAPLPLKKDGTPRQTPPRWMSYTITRMLRNPMYRGSLVDELTWHRAQIPPPHVAGRAWDTTPIYPWPLAGAIKCYCGAGMYGEAGGATGRRIRYYRCSKPFNHDGHRKGQRADRIEAQFFDLLRALEDNPGDYFRPESGPSPALIDRALRDARTQAAEVGKKRDAAWDLEAAGHVRKEDVQGRLDRLTEESATITARIAELETQRAVTIASAAEGETAAEVIAQAVAAWTNPAATPRDKRAVALAIAKFAGGLTIDAQGDLHHGLERKHALKASNGS